jgi:hypothetical protein
VHTLKDTSSIKSAVDSPHESLHYDMPDLQRSHSYNSIVPPNIKVDSPKNMRILNDFKPEFSSLKYEAAQVESPMDETDDGILLDEPVILGFRANSDLTATVINNY